MKTCHFQDVTQTLEGASMRSLLLAVVLSLVPGTALALTFSAPLDGLVGVVDFLPSMGSGEATFDFGQQFSAIESVSIEVEAQVYAREFDVCGTVFDPQPCVQSFQLLGFFAVIDEEDEPFIGSISSRGLSFSDDVEAPQAYGTDLAEFNNLSPTGWDILRDGEGSLSLFWNVVLGIPGQEIRILRQEASGEIFTARLVIEGTPIPEPSTALLVAVGLFSLAGIRHRD